MWRSRAVQTKDKRRTEGMQIEQNSREREREREKEKPICSMGRWDDSSSPVMMAAWGAHCRQRTPLLSFAYGWKRCPWESLDWHMFAVRSHVWWASPRYAAHACHQTLKRGKKAEESCYMPHFVSRKRKKNTLQVKSGSICDSHGRTEENTLTAQSC